MQRADVAQCLMQTLPVIKHFDVIKDRHTGMVISSEVNDPTLSKYKYTKFDKSIFYYYDV